ANAAYRRFRAFALIVPLHFAFEREPPPVDNDPDAIPRVGELALDLRNGVARNFGVWPLVDARQANFDVVDDAYHTGYPFGIGLGLVFLHVAADEPRQGDDPVVDVHGNVGRIDVRVPPQFVLNIAPNIAVGTHARFSISNLAQPKTCIYVSRLQDCSRLQAQHLLCGQVLSRLDGRQEYCLKQRTNGASTPARNVD